MYFFLVEHISGGRVRVDYVEFMLPQERRIDAPPDMPRLDVLGRIEAGGRDELLEAVHRLAVVVVHARRLVAHDESLHETGVLRRNPNRAVVRVAAACLDAP